MFSSIGTLVEGYSLILTNIEDIEDIEDMQRSYFPLYEIWCSLGSLQIAVWDPGERS